MCTFVGIMSSINPHLMNIFGIRNILIIGGFIHLFNQLSTFGAAITSIVISVYCKNAKELRYPYQVVTACGGVISFIGFCMIFFENDEKFSFGDEDKEPQSLPQKENDPNDSLEKEKQKVTENISGILDISNS